MRYYVQLSIEDNNHKNNKKVIKKLTGQISATFDQYLGKNGNGNMNRQPPLQQKRGYDDGGGDDRRRLNRRHDMDSVEDPAEDVEEEDHQDDSE